MNHNILSNTLDSALNAVDINYRGYRSNNPSDSIVKHRKDANINRVLFWLTSKRDDYVRESFKGGPLQDLLGLSINNDVLREYEESIRSRFNEAFANDLDLVLIKLSYDRINRKVIVNMIVKDRLENITFPVSTEVRK